MNPLAIAVRTLAGLAVLAAASPATQAASAAETNDAAVGRELGCMDALFRSYGVADVTVQVDEAPDSFRASESGAGARDLIARATSEMTRTSHAIRLAGAADPYAAPAGSRRDDSGRIEAVIHAKIWRVDDASLHPQADGSVCYDQVCASAAGYQFFSGYALDLEPAAGGIALLPGARVHNAVLVRRRIGGSGDDLSTRAFGVQTAHALAGVDSQPQALRALAAAGAIQLYGRLLKLPYWTCLGAVEANAEVRSEVRAWWDELTGDMYDRSRLVVYLQSQMRNQGVYAGPVDGKANALLLRAVRSYELAMGLADTTEVDAEFLRRYLGADHPAIRKVAIAKLEEIARREGTPPTPPPVVVAAAAPPAPSPAAAEAAAPPVAVATATPLRPAATEASGYHPPEIKVRGSRPAGSSAYKTGEAVYVGLVAAQAGYHYCYEVEGDRGAVQFYPRPDQAQEPLAARAFAVVNSGSPLHARRSGQRQLVACFSSRKNLGKLPMGTMHVDAGLDDLQSRFASAANGPFAMGVFDIRTH